MSRILGNAHMRGCHLSPMDVIKMMTISAARAYPMTRHRKIRASTMPIRRATLASCCGERATPTVIGCDSLSYNTLCHTAATHIPSLSFIAWSGSMSPSSLFLRQRRTQARSSGKNTHGATSTTDAPSHMPTSMATGVGSQHSCEWAQSHHEPRRVPIHS